MGLLLKVKPQSFLYRRKDVQMDQMLIKISVNLLTN